MNSELVEIVARALYACDENENSPVWRQLSAQIVSEYMAEAQAALTALQSAGCAVVPVDPTEAMRASGANELFGSASDDWGDDAALVYTAMLREAVTNSYGGESNAE